MKFPETTMYTIIQMVMGLAMGFCAFALLFGVTIFRSLPESIWVIICMLCIAMMMLSQAVIQIMSAMSMNVEPVCADTILDYKHGD